MTGEQNKNRSIDKNGNEIVHLTEKQVVKGELAQAREKHVTKFTMPPTNHGRTIEKYDHKMRYNIYKSRQVTGIGSDTHL